jgi:hypothetical protein
VGVVPGGVVSATTTSLDTYMRHPIIEGRAHSWKSTPFPQNRLAGLLIILHRSLTPGGKSQVVLNK